MSSFNFNRHLNHTTPTTSTSTTNTNTSTTGNNNNNTDNSISHSPSSFQGSLNSYHHHFSVPRGGAINHNHHNNHHSSSSSHSHFSNQSQFTNITNLCQQSTNRTNNQQPFPVNTSRELSIHQPLIIKESIIKQQQQQDNQTSTAYQQSQQQHQQQFFPNFHESFMSKYQDSQTNGRQSPSSQLPAPQPSYYPRGQGVVSDSSDDVQNNDHQNHHSSPNNNNNNQHNMSYYPRGQGVVYPSIYAPLFDGGGGPMPRIPNSPQQWSRPYPNYFAYLPGLIPPSGPNTSTAAAGGGLGQEPTGASFSYSQEASPPPQSTEMEKVPQLTLGYTPSPPIAPLPYTVHPPVFPTMEGSIKIDLYHKPRGSKGTWMQIAQNDQIRVTEGKGKRLKMIVHSESELEKIALQVALLDSQDIAGSNRRSSNHASSAASPSSSPAPSSTAATPSSSSSSTNQNISNSPPTTTHSTSSPSPTNAGPTTMASSINTSPSPSSFSLSSPAQSPIQSPSQFQANNQYSVAISVTPPSSSPNPILPQQMSTQLPPPDPQGLSVESVRVYRYPLSTSAVALSALEFELKLAKLSKRLCIVLSALTREGVKIEARSVDLYAHNNGKHNANSIRKKNTLPYPSPTLNGYPQRDDQVAPSSPSDRPKRKPLNRSSASASSSALIPNSPLPAPPPLPMSKSSPSIFTSTISTASTNTNQQQQNNSYNISPKIKPESSPLSNPPLPSIPLGPLEYSWAYQAAHHQQPPPPPPVHHHLDNGLHTHHSGHWGPPTDHHTFPGHHHLYSIPQPSYEKNST